MRQVVDDDFGTILSYLFFAVAASSSYRLIWHQKFDRTFEYKFELYICYQCDQKKLSIKVAQKWFH